MIKAAPIPFPFALFPARAADIGAKPTNFHQAREN